MFWRKRKYKNVVLSRNKHDIQISNEAKCRSGLELLLVTEGRITRHYTYIHYFKREKKIIYKQTAQNLLTQSPQTAELM